MPSPEILMTIFSELAKKKAKPRQVDFLSQLKEGGVGGTVGNGSQAGMAPPPTQRTYPPKQRRY